MAKRIGVMGMMVLALSGCAGTPMTIEQAERLGHGNDVAPADERLKIYNRYTNTIPNAYMKAALAKDPAQTAKFTDPGHSTRIGDGIMIAGMLLGLVDSTLGYSIAGAEVFKGFNPDKNHFANNYNVMTWGATYLYRYNVGDDSRSMQSALSDDFALAEKKALLLAKEFGFEPCAIVGYSDKLKYTQAMVQVYDGAYKYRAYHCGRNQITITTVINPTHTIDTESYVSFNSMDEANVDALSGLVYDSQKADIMANKANSFWSAISRSCRACRNGADGLYAYAAGTELESPIPKPMPEI